MANCTQNSLSFLDQNDLNWELLNPFITMNNNPSLLPNSNMDYENIMGLSSGHFLTTQTSQLQAKLSAHTPANSELVDPSVSCVNGNPEYSGTATSNKRKADHLADSSSLNSSSPTSGDRNTQINNSGKGKRMKTNDKVGEKAKDVVHVRARRGQATDSHSIAERIRRGKINERLRCLQDIVPGCNKTKGMAVMLDEIINYVQSLQNQIEFLSMKLTAASQFHDFNSENEPVEKIEKMMACNITEAQDAETIISRAGGYGQELANFIPPTWPF